MPNKPNKTVSGTALAVWLVVLVALGGAFVAWRVWSKPDPLDTRFTGAYALEDGSLIYIAPREGKVLRYRLMNGESSALWPAGERDYEAGPGWAERAPVLVRVTFEVGPDGRPLGFAWQRRDVPAQHAQRVALPEELFRFPSGNITLRAKLVTPGGEGPFPVVVLVHGSGAESAVDSYFEPYLYASHGIAALVFDKRGTGESQGEYTQNFSVLADDVIAAVNALRARTDIDKSRIHLAGFSQGGWIAPLAAVRDGGIRSLLIGYGPMVPVKDEDRWGYVYALRQDGFGEDAVDEVDAINAVIGDIIDRGADRWKELSTLLDQAASKPWFETVRHSDSAVGYATNSQLPMWAVRLYVWWKFERAGEGVPFVDRLYDPVPTVAALRAPSFWILAGEDSSMPTGWTVERLDTQQAAGRPIEYVLYEKADHGILRFEQDASGKRHTLGYEPDYLPQQVKWLRRQSGLE